MVNKKRLNNIKNHTGVEDNRSVKGKFKELNQQEKNNNSNGSDYINIYWDEWE